ncbi:MAG: S41 family peptidase [Chloroflexi bacterium]|nr:S41 family peptidase [Chloroflexota bacterium]
MAVRRVFYYLSLLMLTCLAFGVGYACYPLLNPIGKSVAAADFASVSAQPAATEPADLQIYWEVWQLLDRDFYGPKPAVMKRIYGAIRGLAESYQDPYTIFVEPQPHEIATNEWKGSFGGIGIRFEHTEQGYILHPEPNQPAAQAGIKDKDLLLLVDDKEITPEMSDNDLTALVRGEVGTEVAVVVRRQEAPAKASVELTFRIKRVQFEIPSVEWHLLEQPGNARIGYIKQTIFSERSADEMHRALQELKAAGADRFIWDLRGNPGGLVDSAVQMADIWLDGGLILIEEHVDKSQKTFEATAGDETNQAPLIVLVDGNSASASEIVAGALQDHGRAKLVGEKTYGKGSVQLVYQLPDESSLHVTNAQWFTPKHHQISSHGLTPDVIIAPGEDPLPKAIELVEQ